jgi:hypothetical protein
LLVDVLGLLLLGLDIVLNDILVAEDGELLLDAWLLLLGHVQLV